MIPRRFKRKKIFVTYERKYIWTDRRDGRNSGLDMETLHRIEAFCQFFILYLAPAQNVYILFITTIQFLFSTLISVLNNTYRQSHIEGLQNYAFSV